VGVEKKDAMILVTIRLILVRQSQVKDVVSLTRILGEEVELVKGVSVIFIADPHHANAQVSEDTMN
jgi:hypothetical protein